MRFAEQDIRQKNRGVESGEAVIEVHNLKKSFNGETVLEHVNFNLHKMENIAVMGKSGTGKSVLIKTIVGLHEPDEGEMFVFGKDTHNLTDEELNTFRRKIGYLFQGGALYDSMSVRQNLRFPLERQKKKLSKGEMNDAVEEALSNVGLLEAINKMPAELSGGMKKRIALARTLILKPEIVLYDEPTTGLDPVTSKEISGLINEMREKFNISSMIITHDVSCVRITSDRIFIIHDKTLAVEGSYEELRHSGMEWVRAFFH